LPTITGTMTLVFDGEVTDVALDQSSAGGPHELIVGAMDKSHRLSAQTQVRTFANKTYSAIVETIAGDAGLGKDVTATTGELPFVLQTTNDHAFLWEIADRVGYDWWVTSDGKLNFKPRASTAGPTLTLGDDLIDFKVRYSGATKGKKITVTGWDPEKQQAVTGDDASALSGTSIPAIGSSAAFAKDARGKAVSTWGKDLKSGAFVVTTTNEAKAVAKALATKADAAEVFARGRALTSPALVPGKTAKIAGMGTKASGDYFVTTVEHTFSPAIGIETRFTAGNKAPVGFADIVGGGTGQQVQQFGNLGLVPAVVTNIEDPDKAGRVKVKFPTLTNLESGWARVVSLGAGNGRGFHMMPEVSDEVLVGFEQGDQRYPVVLGGLWSKKNKPPTTTNDKAVKQRLIKTRLGHIIQIDEGDSDDKKAVSITLADKKTKILLAQDKVELESNSGKPISVKTGSHKMEIDGSGNITLKGAKISLQATGDIELKGANVKVTANAGVDIKGNAQVKLNGAAGVNVETSAIAVVKGSMVKIN
ncbi:MAG TPA: phage baseplate assembly protein V, partial [Acidimicrobiales bacterium]|nr:phage baseplate assembly protein V [Acidimicrobiales bacterium]